MATTTPNFGFDIPQSTDLVKDGATAIAALGTDIDTAFVDLKGGTTGQVLSKNSNTDLDFTWVAQDDSNAIQNALLTTTGDTIYASGASTPARLGIGTTGQVLTVSGGLPSWATPATALPPQLQAQVTGEYLRYNQTSQPVDVTFVEDVSVYVPVYLPGYALDRIGFRTGSAHTGTTTVRLGIYNASSTTRLPTTVYLDAGTVAATAASTNYEITIASTPPAGFYWLVLNPQSITGTASIYAYNANESFNALTMPQGTTLNGRANRTYQQTGVTGAFATAGTLASNGTPPHMAVRIG